MGGMKETQTRHTRSHKDFQPSMCPLLKSVGIRAARLRLCIDLQVVTVKVTTLAAKLLARLSHGLLLNADLVTWLLIQEEQCLTPNIEQCVCVTAD